MKVLILYTSAISELLFPVQLLIIHKFLPFYMKVRTGSPVRKRKRKESLPRQESTETPSNNDMVYKAAQLKRRVCKSVVINFHLTLHCISVCMHTVSTLFVVGSHPCSETFFFWVLQFSPLLKNQCFRIPIRSGIRGPQGCHSDYNLLLSITLIK